MARVLAIGDTHAAGMRKGYPQFLEKIADRHKINRVVHVGDLVDWHSIAYHEKHPGTSSAADEYEKARKQVAELSSRFPKADWMIGNHDALTERQAISAGLPPGVLKDYNELWGVKWKTHERFAKLEIDGVLYSHGDGGRGGQGAALKQAKDAFQSVVIGHWHTEAGVSFWANKKKIIFGLSTGCGIDDSLLQFAYGKPFAAKSLLGCGVVLEGERPIWEPWILK